MKKLWVWLRTFNAGDWIALVVLAGGLALVLALVVANTWSTVVGSLQPEIVKFKGTEYDLIAQRSMSAAAWWMAIITAFSAIIGAASLLLIFRTLQEAKRSADAAVQSVRFSEQAAMSATVSADVAAQSLHITREMGQAQVRAYVVLSAATIRVPEAKHPRLSLVIANSGQTPARTPMIQFTAKYLVKGRDGYVEQNSVAFTEMLAELAGQKEETVGFVVPIPLGDGDRRALAMNQAKIVIRGSIQHSTVFLGVEDKRHFAFQTVGSGSSDWTKETRLRILS